MSPPTISKSTGITISIAALLSAFSLIFLAGSWKGGVESSGRQNSSDITKILAILDANAKSDAEFRTTVRGDIIEIKTILKSWDADDNKVSVVRSAPVRPVVVVTSQGSTQPISQAPGQTQPPSNNQSPQPQSPNSPQQAPSIPCTLLPILCNQGRLL